MGTAFGLDACLAATPVDTTRAPSELATGACADPSRHIGQAEPGFWRRLGGRFTPGR
jgi:hypothetical protein